MRASTLILGAALLGALSAGALAGNGHGRGGHGGGKGRPSRAVAELTNAGVDTDAAGKVDVKHFPAVGKRAERSWFRVKVRHLDAAGSYTLWMDDPATDLDATLVQVADVTITANDRGGSNMRIDTKKGGVLPFGSTLPLLSGKALEIRDANGAAVLTGAVPAVQ